MPRLLPQTWVGLAVSALAFVVYLLTLSPTVNFIDSGELITVGATAGIAHTPGYPLYTLLIVAAAALPLGNPAVQINFVSAVFGAVGVGLFYTLVYEALAHHLRPPLTPAPSVRSGQALSQRERGRTPHTAALAQRERGIRTSAPALAQSERETQPLTPAHAQRERGTRASVPARPNRQAARQPGSRSTSSPSPTPSRTAAPAPKPDTSYLVSRTSYLDIAAAGGAAVLLAAAQAYWDWATQAKMYSLHFAFVAALFWLALRVRRAVRESGAGGALWPPQAWPAPARWLVALAVVLGLTFTNHSTSLLILPGLAWLLLWPVAGSGAGSLPAWRWALRYIPALVVAGIVPLLIYLYLPLRASQNPILNWGEPSNWRDFWRHVTLWQYHGYIAPQGALGDYIGLALSFATNQLGPWLGAIALLLAGAGVVRLARTNWPLIVTPAVTIVIIFFFTFSDQNAEIEAYSTPMYMMLLFWAGIGLAWALHALRDRLFSAEASSQEPIQSAIRNPQSAIALLPVLLGLLALGWNAGRAGHRADYSGEAYVRNHMAYLEPNAVLITDNWYITSPTYYLQHVLGERRDVAVIDKNLVRYPFYIDYMDRQYADVLAPVKQDEAAYRAEEALWYDDKPYDTTRLPQLYFDFLRAIISKNLAAGRPVYLEWYTQDGEAQTIGQGFNVHPEGLTLRVDPQPPTTPPRLATFDWRGILSDPVPRDRVAHWVLDYYPVALDRLAAYAQGTNQTDQAAQYRAQAAAVRAALGLPAP